MDLIKMISGFVKPCKRSHSVKCNGKNDEYDCFIQNFILLV